MEHKVERTFRSVSVGAGYIAPLVTFIYNFVDKVTELHTTKDFIDLRSIIFISLLKDGVF